MAIVSIIYHDGYEGPIDAEIGFNIELLVIFAVILKVNFLNEILKLLCICCFLISYFSCLFFIF